MDEPEPDRESTPDGHRQSEDDRESRSDGHRQSDSDTNAAPIDTAGLEPESDRHTEGTDGEPEPDRESTLDGHRQSEDDRESISDYCTTVPYLSHLWTCTSACYNT